jgi:tetratricopeptide (TPR) repeat protein
LLLAKARCLVKENKATEAVSLFDQLLKSDSKSSKLHFYKGLALEKLGKKQEALKSFQQAKTADPSNEDILDAIERISKTL